MTWPRSTASDVFGEAEVEHLGPSVGGDHHVRRLEITVDDSGRVRVREHLGHLHGPVGCGRHVGQACRKPVGQRLPDDALHRDVEPVAIGRHRSELRG